MNIRHLFFQKHIEALQVFFEQRLGLQIQIGAELEFYLRSDCQDKIDKILEELAQKCFRVETEKGWQQYECVFDHHQPSNVLASEIYEIKNLVQFLARQNDCQASFEAKPYNNDYGSALHFHLSLHDKNGQNLFASKVIDENALIGKALAGLLDISSEAVYLLCRKQKDFSRFVTNFLAPTHISWGGNNRTTILRVPDSKPQYRRIEFRLPPSSADPAACVFVLMIGLLHGLTHQLKLPDRVYGNAFDDQYELSLIPNTLEESKIAFEKGGKILYLMKKISPTLVPDFNL